MFIYIIFYEYSLYYPRWESPIRLGGIYLGNRIIDSKSRLWSWGWGNIIVSWKSCYLALVVCITLFLGTFVFAYVIRSKNNYQPIIQWVILLSLFRWLLGICEIRIECLEGYLSNNNNDDMGILDIEWL